MDHEMQLFSTVLLIVWLDNVRYKVSIIVDALDMFQFDSQLNTFFAAISSAARVLF